MPAGFRALRDNDVGAGFGGAQSFGSFSGHVHDLRANVVGAPKVVAQVLVFARPGKGDDGRLSAQSHREHVFLDLKQQMIDAERLVRSLANRCDLGFKASRR